MIIMGKELANCLGALLGQGASIAWSLCDSSEGLFPSEARLIEKACKTRREEFAAGRRAAREALADFGHCRYALLFGAGRAPAWPRGISGSLTHDQGVALAAVVRSDENIGIDLTAAEALLGATRSEILPHRDEGFLDDLSARAAFSAKESLFKALFPCAEVYFGFEAAIAAPASDNSMILRLDRAIGPYEKGAQFNVKVGQVGRVILTALRIPTQRLQR